MKWSSFLFFVSSRRRHTSWYEVTGVQTCALPISPGDGSRRVEAIGPFAPVVERALRVRREARDDEILVPQELRRLEASLPPNQDDRGRHVRRRRAEPLGLQRG